MHNAMACDNCNDSANSQKLLPCFHSFCLHCLHEREKNWSDDEKKTCPKCDEEFRTPSQDLDDNAFAERFCRLERGLCDVCSDDQDGVDPHEVPPATTYCPLCCQGLCERCAVEHRRQKLSKSHRLMEFSSPDVLMKASQTDALVYCVEHSATSQRVLCSTCQRLVCVLCFLEDHAEKNHRWSKKPDEEIAELRKRLQQSVDQMSSLLGDVRQVKERVVGDESRRLNREERQTKEEIGRHYESLKEVIDEHRNQLLLELDARKSKTLEQIERRIDAKTRKLSNRLTGCINYFQQVTTFGSYDELHSTVVKLQRTSGLQNFKERYQKEIEDYRLTDSIALTFQPTQLPTDNFIGSITCRSTSRRARIQLDDAGKKDAWGVTWLDNCIYILTSNSILKFSDQSPFDRIDEIVMFDAERYLSDIAACLTNERLYIIDQVDFRSNETSPRDRTLTCESCIWKVETNSDPRNEVSLWVTKRTNSFLFTLSVSPSGQVIVANASHQNSIELYDKDGALVESIRLDIRFANHAVATNDHGFVVAYGKYQGKHGLRRIVGLRDQRDVTDLDLDNPWHLAVYENDEILLADTKNDRVLLLHPTLELKRELLTKEHDEVAEPRRLCYVKERRTLIVIHGEKGKTRVVDLFYDNYWGMIGP